MPLFYNGPTLADTYCNPCQIKQITSQIRSLDRADTKEAIINVEFNQKEVSILAYI